MSYTWFDESFIHHGTDSDLSDSSCSINEGNNLKINHQDILYVQIYEAHLTESEIQVERDMCRTEGRSVSIRRE